MPSRSLTLFLVRHGQTEWNVERRMQGQFDSALTAYGRRQANVNGRFLAEQGIEQIYASPLGRVRSTLEEIHPYLEAPVTFDDRLMEWNSGEWSSHLYTELHWRWPAEFAAWENDRFHVRPPNGENYLDMIERGKSAIDDIVKNGATTVAILSHGMIGRALCSHILGLDERTTLRIRQRNEIIIKLTMGGSSMAEHFISGKGPLPGLPLEKA